jgi:hypothetical protein
LGNYILCKYLRKKLILNLKIWNYEICEKMFKPPSAQCIGPSHAGSEETHCITGMYLRSNWRCHCFVQQDGLTPLHCGARSGHEQVVEMLLDRAAPILSKTKVMPFQVSAHYTVFTFDSPFWLFNWVFWIKYKK